MIPFAIPQDFKSDILAPKNVKKALWFIFAGDQLLVTDDDKKKPPNHHSLRLIRSLYMGTFKERHLFAGELEISAHPPKGYVWYQLRALFHAMDEELYALAGRALQLIYWDRTNKYCGRCGNATFPRNNERCRECTSCGHLFYPKLTPAILALIKKDDQILLASNAQFPEKFYSIIAGFVDPGETLEQCVAREIQEEVGLIVKNIRYFASQPWPFSHSLMIGFTCEWEKGEIRIDLSELDDAGWFDASNLPQLPPHLSLARILIDSFILRP